MGFKNTSSFCRWLLALLAMSFASTHCFAEAYGGQLYCFGESLWASDKESKKVKLSPRAAALFLNSDTAFEHGTEGLSKKACEGALENLDKQKQDLDTELSQLGCFVALSDVTTDDNHIETYVMPANRGSTCSSTRSHQSEYRAEIVQCMNDKKWRLLNSVDLLINAYCSG